ncbi:ATP-binding protein [Streptomyces xanthophaeus]|uniref:Histidine kinase/HSP90-like ATPase domain-containing protein n=1 Tax=Streptomyces xanthophaeus TaxID=67385 RepID=A0A919GST5_9ACTN|nr:hypothetical protein Sxan_05640 [Streptomyces xanthophaeus]
MRSLIECSRERADGTGSPSAHEALTDALLVTSELVSNAIRHGGGLLDFSAAVVEDGLQLVVTDASRDAPFVTPRRAGTVPVGGFGWPLVLRLARSVTIRPTEQGGKSIVAVLPLDGPVGPARASAGR